MKYVCGFLFSNDLSKVVLIRKKKPEWQKGKLNGVGGKIEIIKEMKGSVKDRREESGQEAMIREFKEETDVTIRGWVPLCRIDGPDDNVYSVEFFYAQSDFAFDCKSTTDEIVLMLNTANILAHKHEMIPNLQWLIPLAIDMATTYSGKISL